MLVQKVFCNYGRHNTMCKICELSLSLHTEHEGCECITDYIMHTLSNYHYSILLTHILQVKAPHSVARPVPIDRQRELHELKLPIPRII